MSFVKAIHDMVVMVPIQYPISECSNKDLAKRLVLSEIDVAENVCSIQEFTDCALVLCFVSSQLKVKTGLHQSQAC